MKKQSNSKNNDDKKKISKSTIFLIVLSSLLLVLFVCVLTDDIKRGWNGEKTLRYTMFVFVFICGIVTSIPLATFFVYSNNKIIKSNNDLYRTFERVEKNKKIKAFQRLKNNQAKSETLERINNLISERFSAFVPLTHDSIDEFMKMKRYKNPELLLDEDTMVKILVLYNKYTNLYSKEFEKKYSDFKTAKMISRPSFPFLTTILPTILGVISVLGLIYQEVNAMEKQSEPIFSYAVIIIEVVLLGVISAWQTADGAIPNIIKNNNQMIEELEAVLKIKTSKTVNKK